MPRIRSFVWTSVVCVLAAISVQAGTLDKAIENEKLVFAHRESSVLFSYLAGPGKPIGFTVENKKVAITTSTTNMLVVRRHNEEKQLGMSIVRIRDYADAMLLVEVGHADALVMDCSMV